jgi:hypothetical protein
MRTVPTFYVYQPRLTKITAPKAGDCVELILLYSLSKVRSSFTGVFNAHVVTAVIWIVVYIHKTGTVNAIWVTEYDMFRKELREF